MKHHKILNLLNETINSKFLTRKWNIFHDQLKTNYAVENKIICSAEVLESNPCDYIDAYILVGGGITIIGCDVKRDSNSI